MYKHQVCAWGSVALLLMAGLATTAVAPPVRAQAFPGSSLQVSLPFDLVDTLDGAKFKIRVPANWNGTLLVYTQGSKTGPAPAEPAIVPTVLPGADEPLDTTLLARGYALAASAISDEDWQMKASLQDTAALTAYFRGRVGSPKRVILWGTTIGGLASLRLMEDNPRSYDGAIAMAAPDAGISKRQDQALDFVLAYAVVFGWRDDLWGPVEYLRSDINFSTDVAPLIKWPAPDGSNRGGWEFIRLVTGWSSDSFWKTDPLFGYPGYILKMNFSVADRAKTQLWAGGPIAQNMDHRYTLTPEDVSYLAGMGVQAEDLLKKMNARTNIYASPIARDYVVRFGDVHGTLTKPVLTMHTTMDTVSDIRHESAYRQMVEGADCMENLVQAYVATLGHYAFTAKQLLAGLAALESWLDTGTPPGPAAFPTDLGFDNTYVPAPWPY